MEFTLYKGDNMGIYSKIIDIQKLNQAWDRVKKNKPAAGVDHITAEQYEEARREEIKQLNMELSGHTYQALPVRQVVIYKGEKARTIALYAMRDKVVQQSIAVELNRKFDKMFSPQTYAYRSNKSALNAIHELEKKAQTGQYQVVLKLDIRHFFDEIKWETLRDVLKKYIKEEDVLELIEQNARTKMVDENGEIKEKSLGIHQGSGISPILSNIYLMEFDQWLMKKNCYFIRYSDDLLLLLQTKEDAYECLKEIRTKLSQYGLQLNDHKTVCAGIIEGVDFLGYHFDNKGKSIPAKAELNLYSRLETMWLTSTTLLMEEKIKKATEIVGGWEQYFRGERQISSIFEYVCAISVLGNDIKYQEQLRQQRVTLNNPYSDIMRYLSSYWGEKNDEQMELLEYEQYYQIWDGKLLDDKGGELLTQYRKLIIAEDVEIITELIQGYTDLQMYEKASFWLSYREKFQKKLNKVISVQHFTRENGAGLIFNHMTAEKIYKIFVGREDIYGVEELNYGRKRENSQITMPVTENKIYEHLVGKHTLGTYIQRQNATVKYLVFDIDISKKVLLEYDRKSQQFEQYLKLALNLAIQMQKILDSFGIKGYIEYSGNRGFHVWIFFTEWIPVRYVNMLSEVILIQLGTIPEGITIETFPNKTRIKPDKFGQIIKIPYGYHIKTGEQSYFLNESCEKELNVNQFLDSIAKFPLTVIKKILASNVGINELSVKQSVDNDLSGFGELQENVKEVLEKCNLMRYLCQKALKTAYLTHFERQSILYIFGHLGEEGKEFVHKIMSFTLNYDYNVTEKFIRKIPDKPVSCIKLREQYKMVTAEFGCSCNFKRTKNCYPSPVLHAIALSTEDSKEITLPTSRTVTKEKAQEMLSEMNVHQKAQQLASKILELKKQKRSIDVSIKKVEKELEKIYDNVNTDCLELEIGLLVRRKTEDGYEWVIEI